MISPISSLPQYHLSNNTFNEIFTGSQISSSLNQIYPIPLNHIRTIKFLLCICSLLYASTYMFTKDLQNQNMAPSIISLFRFFIASICFIPQFLSYKGDFKSLLKCIEIGIWSGLGFISQAYSLQYSSSSKVSFFCGTGVVMPPIISYISHKLSSKQPSESHLTQPAPSRQSFLSHITHMLYNIYYEIPKLLPLSSILALCGGVVMELGGLEAPTWYDLSLLFAPFSFAMCFWKSDLYNKQHPNQSLFVTGTLLATTTFMCMIWSIFSHSFPTSHFEWSKLYHSIINNKSILLGFLYTGLITTALTGVIEQYAMNYISSSQIALIYTLEPIFATIFGITYLNEKLTYMFVVGAMFTLLACILDSKHQGDVEVQVQVQEYVQEQVVNIIHIQQAQAQQQQGLQKQHEHVQLVGREQHEQQQQP